MLSCLHTSSSFLFLFFSSLTYNILYIISFFSFYLFLVRSFSFPRSHVYSLSTQNNRQSHPPIIMDNFTIPLPLQLLSDECHEFHSQTYMYKVCPFRNVTQEEHDLSVRQNVSPLNTRPSFRGTLGYWDGKWIIRDNNVVGITYTSGDDCKGRMRKSFVRLSCGTQTQLLKATEPRLCEYTFELMIDDKFCTPNKTLPVYSLLPLKRQRQWDTIYTLLTDKHLDWKSYKRILEMIWRESGLTPSSESFVADDINHDIAQTTTVTVDSDAQIDEETITDLHQCMTSLNRTKEQLKWISSRGYEP